MFTNKNYVLDSRYKEQQKVLLNIANQLGVVYFKPDYHAKNNDCNTVLFYFKKDYDKAVAMEKAGCDQHSKEYPKCFWFFENTDINGHFSLKWANRGKIDLSAPDWVEKLTASAKLAMLNRQQFLYATAVGGSCGIRESDDVYNDMNRDIIQEFWRLHGTAFIGSINLHKDREAIVNGEKSAFTEYKGEKVYNFGADCIVPVLDETLNELIRCWNSSEGNTAMDVKAIFERVELLGGISFIWY